MKQERIFAFDAIRVIAMLFIIVFHYNAGCASVGIIAEPILFIQYANGTMGHIGVSLFFILSGASLMCAYGRSFSLRPYLRKRFLSIYPLYWISYAAFFFHFYIKSRLPMQLPKWTLLLSLLGFDGYLYYKIPCYYLVGEWFVGCIILLYLLFPLLRFLLLKYPRMTIALTLILVIPYIRFYALDMDIERFFLSRVPEFLSGMVISCLLLGIPPFAKPSDTTRTVPFPLTLCSLAVFAALLFIPFALPQLLLAALSGLSAFILLAGILGHVKQAHIKELFKQVSACSFAIFLCHHLLAGIFLGKHTGQSFSFLQNHLLFAQYLALTFFCGLILYLLSVILSRGLDTLLFSR